MCFGTRLVPRPEASHSAPAVAIGVPLAAPVVDRWGAVPIFWVAAALAAYFAVSLRNRRV
jgi:hypothetical protein